MVHGPLTGLPQEVQFSQPPRLIWQNSGLHTEQKPRALSLGLLGHPEDLCHVSQSQICTIYLSRKRPFLGPPLHLMPLCLGPRLYMT